MWSASLMLAGLLCGSLADAETSFDGATPVVRYDFESNGDLDLDGMPDDWVRRTGEGFPQYVSIEIDRQIGKSSRQSLRFNASGADAALYSPLVAIDPRHTFVFRGKIRTEGLRSDAATISVSFLNARRQRLQRYLTVPVTGTHEKWVPVEIRGMAPRSDTVFCVIGCHISGQTPRDVTGYAWFDELEIGRLPRLEIEGDIKRRFVNATDTLRTKVIASGITAGKAYSIVLRMRDDVGRTLVEERRPLDQVTGLAVKVDSAAKTESVPIYSQSSDWILPPLPPGYYVASVLLQSEGREIAAHDSSLAVVDLVTPSGIPSEFGWTLERQVPAVHVDEFVRVANQSGLGWLKYPVWERSQEGREVHQSNTLLFEGILASQMRIVGVIDNPPPKLRRQFPEKWTGISELFSMPESVWASSLQPVFARYAAIIGSWQIGTDNDFSFVGRANTAEALGVLDKEISRLGRKVESGLPWDANTPLPAEVRRLVEFSTLNTQPDESFDQLRNRIQRTQRVGLPVWISIDPQSIKFTSKEERAARLARLVITAKEQSVHRIFFQQADHVEDGLITEEGAPLPLWLPWRTLAIHLRGTTYAGTMDFPNGTSNAVFVRGDEAVIAVWSGTAKTERLFLGHNATQYDLWGRSKPLDLDQSTNEQSFEVGTSPTLIVGCSAAVARLRATIRWERGQIASEYGGHADAILGVNTFPQGISGRVTVTPPKNWTVSPDAFELQVQSGESFRLPTFLTMPPDANLGMDQTMIAFDITADRRYKFNVYRPYRVGLDDIGVSVVERRLPDGQLEIEQTISNRTSPPEVLNFRCTLFVPDSRRQKILVARLAPGGDDRKIYLLPNADKLVGQTLWIRMEQDGGKRVLNYRWVVEAKDPVAGRNNATPTKRLTSR